MLPDDILRQVGSYSNFRAMERFKKTQKGIKNPLCPGLSQRREVCKENETEITAECCFETRLMTVFYYHRKYESPQEVVSEGDNIVFRGSRARVILLLPFIQLAILIDERSRKEVAPDGYVTKAKLAVRDGRMTLDAVKIPPEP